MSESIWSFMKNNILIVESKNDKHFVEALVKWMNISDQFSAESLCIDEYECLGGLNLKNLTSHIDTIAKKTNKQGIGSIGILVDADSESLKDRLAMISKAVSDGFADTINIAESGKFYQFKYDNCNFQIACELMNVNGKGELETVLKAIKKKDSVHADCMDVWRDCLTKNEIVLSVKEFDKFWIQVYQRYDCCDKDEREQAGKECNDVRSYEKNIYDFGHDLLKNLREFLTKLSDNS